MPAASPRIHEAPDDLLAAIDYCYEQGWTDGLPVVPPQVDRVHAHAGRRRPPGRDRHRQASRHRTGTLPARRRGQRRHGGLPAVVFPGAGRGLRGHGPAGLQLPRLDRQHRRLGAAPGGERADRRRDRHERRRQPVRPRQPAQRHHRPGRAADPAQRLPDAARHLRQVDPGQPGQVQPVHRRAHARQPVAAALPGAGLRTGVSSVTVYAAAASAMSRTTAATRPSRSWARSPTPWPTTAASPWARAW